MLIRLGYDIQFELTCATPMVALLNVHPSRESDLLEPDQVEVSPSVTVTTYLDTFGNRCSRFVGPAGRVRLTNSSLIYDSGEPDPVNPGARECAVGDLPNDVLIYLLSSRYCEVDRLSNIAYELFGESANGWARVQAVCDWVHQKVKFSYAHARPTKTALDV